MRVLIAEDEPVSQQIARHLLEHAGYSVDIACNGQDTLAMLTTTDYGVLLLDLRLPDMNGYAVVAAIRERFALLAQPWIIALSAAIDPGNEETYLARGLDDCMGKPLRGMALLAAVQRGMAAWAARREGGETKDEGR